MNVVWCFSFKRFALTSGTGQSYLRATILQQEWSGFLNLLPHNRSQPVLQLTLALWELANNPRVQGRLREEIVEKLGQIRSTGRDDFTVDDFDSMPYLLAVGKVCLQ